MRQDTPCEAIFEAKHAPLLLTCQWTNRRPAQLCSQRRHNPEIGELIGKLHHSAQSTSPRVAARSPERRRSPRNRNALQRFGDRDFSEGVPPPSAFTLTDFRTGGGTLFGRLPACKAARSVDADRHRKSLYSRLRMCDFVVNIRCRFTPGGTALMLRGVVRNESTACHADRLPD